MPTKRTRRSRGRNGTITMNSLTMEQLLSFLAGWYPLRSEHERCYGGWQTWAEFMSDWVAVRDECLATEPFQRGGPNFAEQIYQAFGIQGPPANATYEEIQVAIAVTEDDLTRELLADVDAG